MRPYIELVEIGLKLHNLEEIKELLNYVLEDVDLVKKKGELWIEEKETSTFMEMKQFITEKTSEILNRCTSVSSDQTKELDVPALKVAKGNKEDASSKTETEILTLASKDTVYLQLTEKVKEIDSNFSLQSKKLKKLQQKLKDQQTIIKRQEDITEKLFKDCEKENNSKMSETQITFNERVQEIRVEFMTELQAASSFISQQQTQWETFCLELKEKQEKDNENKDLDVSTKFEELFEQQKELSKKLENILEMQQESQEMKQIHGQQTLEMKKVKTESLDQATGLSDFKCIEDSQLHIGHHEQQVSTLGVPELVRHLANCEMNPGHANFIPIETFSIKDLPQAHQNTDMYAFIKAASNLTVKISVTKTSQYRPKCWPYTEVPYFLNDMRERDCLRTGSGMVVKVSKGEGINIDQWIVTVQTATSVVFDFLEAKCTSLRFFYDAEDSPEVVLNYVDCSIYKNVNQDTCFIDFETYDEQLAAELQSLVMWYDTLYQKVNITANYDDFMFIVSHPHGFSKQIGVGQLFDQLKSKNSPDKITCFTNPGSSGAVVHCIGYLIGTTPDVYNQDKTIAVTEGRFTDVTDVKTI